MAGWENEFRASGGSSGKVLRGIFKILLVILVIAVIIGGMVFLFLRMNEDDWIKDSKGLWIKHGNPSQVSSEVLEQQDAISCASELYANASLSNVTFSSQCLGTCSSYSVDIVHEPRTSEDDAKENQCSDFMEGKTKNFIELNSQGSIVRVN